ncbi:unnamed protein product [Heterobilharzia americana]|nr:unnamed protein product [Heterobilharzia americana]CAH8513488.1 unnamed protein product [Heterobilharzia americana]
MSLVCLYTLLMLIVAVTGTQSVDKCEEQVETVLNFLKNEHIQTAISHLSCHVDNDWESYRTMLFNKLFNPNCEDCIKYLDIIGVLVETKEFEDVYKLISNKLCIWSGQFLKNCEKKAAELLYTISELLETNDSRKVCEAFSFCSSHITQTTQSIPTPKQVHLIEGHKNMKTSNHLKKALNICHN